jgi:hypothetical protein
VRAAVVLIIFVVAAIALVAVGTRPMVSGDAATTTTTTSTTAPKTPPTTTTTTVAPSAVTVVVANATQTNGLAGHYTTVLAAHGWAMQTALDATATEQSSAVYFASNYQAEAVTIASTLGLKPAAVLPLTAAVPVTGITGDDVVVVAGSDLVAGA